jgi:carboxyl-terminal processing protease
VLVDSNSASSAEILARLVQIERRGTVIGDRTAGAVMTARFMPHTYGDDKVTFYSTFISVGELRLPDGASLERVGVTPDETVLPTGADLAASRDPVLARAMTLLGRPMTAEEAAAIYH